MRRLTVLRHAHASDAPPGGDDFDRPLSDRGRDAARELGTRFAAELPTPQRLCISPALRTRTTAELACNAAWPSVSQDLSSSLYLASLAALMKEIASTPDSCGHLVLVGHNPGLSELWSLVGGEAGFGGLAPCEWRSREFDVPHWSEVVR